jgi:hypothetical protein
MLRVSELIGQGTRDFLGAHSLALAFLTESVEMMMSIWRLRFSSSFRATAIATAE